MLILSRQCGQKIWIDERICVTVIEAHGGRVRLGFEAPKAINIRREELAPLGYETIQEEVREKDVN